MSTPCVCCVLLPWAACCVFMQFFGHVSLPCTCRFVFRFFLSIHSNHHSPRVAANCSWPCLSDVCCPHSQKLTSVCSLGYRFVDGWPCRCSAADFWHGYKIFCYAYYSHSAPHECEFRETKLGECCPPPVFCFHLLCSLRCCLLHFNVLCVRLMSPCCGWPCRAASVALTCWPN